MLVVGCCRSACDGATAPDERSRRRRVGRGLRPIAWKESWAGTASTYSGPVRDVPAQQTRRRPAQGILRYRRARTRRRVTLLGLRAFQSTSRCRRATGDEVSGSDIATQIEEFICSCAWRAPSETGGESDRASSHSPVHPFFGSPASIVTPLMSSRVIGFSTVPRASQAPG